MDMLTVASFIGAGLLLIGIIVTGNLKQWLLWAVSEAERYLGSGTGALKLRYVYDLAVMKFPFAKYLVPFEIFSRWVDLALEQMKEQIQYNDRMKSFIEG